MIPKTLTLKTTLVVDLPHEPSTPTYPREVIEAAIAASADACRAKEVLLLSKVPHRLRQPVPDDVVGWVKSLSVDDTGRVAADVRVRNAIVALALEQRAKKADVFTSVAMLQNVSDDRAKHVKFVAFYVLPAAVESKTYTCPECSREVEAVGFTALGLPIMPTHSPADSLSLCNGSKLTISPDGRAVTGAEIAETSPDEEASGVEMTPPKNLDVTVGEFLRTKRDQAPPGAPLREWITRLLNISSRTRDLDNPMDESTAQMIEQTCVELRGKTYDDLAGESRALLSKREQMEQDLKARIQKN